MADEPMKAGKYELLAGSYRRTTSKPGAPYEYEMFRRGDVVDMTAEEAERLRDVICKPGERQRREAARLRAEAERLAKAAEEREAAAKEADSTAKSSSRDAAKA